MAMSALTITATRSHDLRQATERFAAAGFPDVHDVQGGTASREPEGAVRRLFRNRLLDRVVQSKRAMR